MQSVIVRSRWDEPGVHSDPFRLHAFGLHERMPPGMQHYPHGIDRWLLIYFHDPVTVVLGRDLTTVDAHTLVVWPPGASQTYGDEALDWDHSWLHVSGTTIEPLLREHGIQPDSINTVGNPAPFEQLLANAARELSRWADPNQRVLRNFFETALIDLARTSAVARLPDENLLRVKMMIDTQPGETPTLAQMAAAACLSVSHFSACFRDAFGQPPIQYLTSRKIELAMHILRTRPATIAEVAERVGYADPFHFSRMFKRTTGLSPRAWRARLSRF